MLYFQAQNGEESELPGGETEIQKPDVNFIDEKLQPANGVAILAGEAKKAQTAPLDPSTTGKVRYI